MVNGSANCVHGLMTGQYQGIAAMRSILSWCALLAWPGSDQPSRAASRRLAPPKRIPHCDRYAKNYHLADVHISPILHPVSFGWLYQKGAPHRSSIVRDACSPGAMPCALRS